MELLRTALIAPAVAEDQIATLMAGYRYRDSNIGFLNAQTFLGGAMIGIQF